MTIMPPPARPQVTDPLLERPDWVNTRPRNPDLLWLDKNENCDPEYLALVARVIASLDVRTQSTYPDSAELYRRLADWVGVTPRQLVLAAGSDGLIRSVFEAYIAPGDTVVITVPSFAMYSIYCQMYGARTVGLGYQASDHGPALGSGNVIQVILKERPRLVCIPNPDSPTGTVFPTDELRAIVEAAGEVGTLILIDEAYHPFCPASVVPWIASHPHLIVARTTAKAWGMAGLRIGYGVASPEVTSMLHKVRPMYECSTIGVATFQTMLAYATDMQASVKRLEAGKKVFLDAMEALGLRVLRGQGNFMHVAFGKKAPDVHARLAGICYYRRDFEELCLKGFSRFSSTTEEQFDPIIGAIREVIGNQRAARKEYV